jgi:transcriptional regulator with XRE-family HTH domain
MAAEEFSRLRKLLGKSQKELAEILGISRKAVESYEQGWRKVPVNTERMLYFLLFKLKEPLLAGKGSCWDERACPDSVRQTCMTWLVGEGHYCWFFTGKLCAARRPENQESGPPDAGGAGGNDLAVCRSCPVFRELVDLIMEHSARIARAADDGAEAATIPEREPEGETECP